MQKTLAYIAVALVFILGVFSGFFLRGLRPGPPAPIQADTVYVEKTIFVETPVPVEVVPKGYEAVPIGTIDAMKGEISSLEDSLERKPRVVVRDSLVYVDVPMEQKHYSDSSFDAWVSGYRPTLDSLHIVQRTAYINVPYPVNTRWSISLQSGVTYMPGIGIRPYLGAGVSYNLISFNLKNAAQKTSAHKRKDATNEKMQGL